MDWTPVRIRGRKVDRGKGKPLESNLEKPSTRYPAIFPPPKGSKRLGVAVATPSSKRRRKIRPKHSYLEDLPVELLQNIFTLAMNISLPLCSKILASKLSSEHVYMDMSIKTLYRHKQLHNGTSTCEVNPNCGQPSQLFQRRFFTWSFFKNYAFKAYTLWNEVEDCDPLEVSEVLNNAELGANYPPYLDMPKFRIPEKLLVGPWTDDLASFLFTLVWLGGDIDWLESTSGDLATSALHEAIVRGQSKVITALVWPTLAVPISIEHLRAAVRDNNCERSIILQLIWAESSRSSETTLDYHDPELWAWATEEERRGNETGTWLKDILRRADQKELFIDDDMDRDEL